MIERVQKSLDDCSLNEIREFIQVVLGISEMRGNETGVQLSAILAKVGYNVNFITVPMNLDHTIPSAARPDDDLRTKVEDGVTFHKIMIHTNDRAGGDRPVPVGVNGRMMLIPRGTAVWVPATYIEVLKNAKEHIYDEYDANSNLLGGLTGMKEVSAYPYSLV
jgi:hypothetical protein